MKMNYSDMFDCISDKSAEILNEYEEYELDTVFSAVNTEKVVISKIMNRVPSVKKKSLRKLLLRSVYPKKEKSGNGEYYLQRQ